MVRAYVFLNKTAFNSLCILRFTHRKDFFHLEALSAPNTESSVLSFGFGFSKESWDVSSENISDVKIFEEGRQFDPLLEVVIFVVNQIYSIHNFKEITEN